MNDIVRWWFQLFDFGFLVVEIRMCKGATLVHYKFVVFILLKFFVLGVDKTFSLLAVLLIKLRLFMPMMYQRVDPFPFLFHPCSNCSLFFLSVWKCHAWVRIYFAVEIQTNRRKLLSAKQLYMNECWEVGSWSIQTLVSTKNINGCAWPGAIWEVAPIFTGRFASTQYQILPKIWIMKGPTDSLEISYCS